MAEARVVGVRLADEANNTLRELAKSQCRIFAGLLRIIFEDHAAKGLPDWRLPSAHKRELPNEKAGPASPAINFAFPCLTPPVGAGEQHPRGEGHYG